MDFQEYLRRMSKLYKQIEDSKKELFMIGMEPIYVVALDKKERKIKSKVTDYDNKKSGNSLRIDLDDAEELIKAGIPFRKEDIDYIIDKWSITKYAYCPRADYRSERPLDLVDLTVLNSGTAVCVHRSNFDDYGYV